MPKDGRAERGTWFGCLSRAARELDARLSTQDFLGAEPRGNSTRGQLYTRELSRAEALLKIARSSEARPGLESLFFLSFFCWFSVFSLHHDSWDLRAHCLGARKRGALYALPTHQIHSIHSFHLSFQQVARCRCSPWTPEMGRGKRRVRMAAKYTHVWSFGLSLPSLSRSFLLSFSLSVSYVVFPLFILFLILLLRCVLFCCVVLCSKKQKPAWFHRTRGLEYVFSILLRGRRHHVVYSWLVRGVDGMFFVG